MRPYLEKTHHKNRAGRVAQVVEHLFSKCEALSSKPNIAKEKSQCHGREKSRKMVPQLGMVMCAYNPST
jgi:hypothetical protein